MVLSLLREICLIAAVYSPDLTPQSTCRVSTMYIYLHGFNSSGASAKGRYFTTALAPATVHTPSYPPDPDAAIQQLWHWLSGLQDARPVLIGSSLGGYYAQYLAQRWRLPMVLINPALTPQQTLVPYLGWQTNYYTGERYYFGERQLAALGTYEIPEPCQSPVPALLLLDRGDELIDYRAAAARYADCAEVRIFPGGNHQFSHLAEAATAIRRFKQKVRS